MGADGFTWVKLLNLMAARKSRHKKPAVVTAGLQYNGDGKKLTFDLSAGQLLLVDSFQDFASSLDRRLGIALALA